MSQALYRKWRPREWDEIVGQQHVVQTLRHATAAERVAHAYLFAGPRGTGKTTTARLLAKAVNCLAPDPADRPCNQCAHCQAINQGRFMDIIEIDAASNTGVDDIRQLRDKIAFAPVQGRYKVYIIDEVHMLSTAAFNALLKTLEEPPAHAIFVLATTEVHKIPATVLSRCQRYEFRRIPVDDIVGYLQRIVEGEHLEAEPEALTWLARQATGSLRDAISLLDQLASTGRPITVALAREVLGTATDQTVAALVGALAQRDLTPGLEIIQQALDRGADPRQLARQVVSYLRQVLLTKSHNADLLDLPEKERLLVAQQAQAFELPRLLRAMRAFEAAAAEGRTDWHPSLPLELAFLEAVAASPQPAAAPSSPPRQTGAPSTPPSSASSSPPSAAPDGAGAGAAAAAPAPLTMPMLRDGWKQALQQLDHPLVSLLQQQQAAPLGVQGHEVVIGLRGGKSSQLLLLKPERQQTVQQALRAALGRPVTVRFKPLPAKGEFDPDILQQYPMAQVAVELGGKVAAVEKSPHASSGKPYVSP